MKKRLYYLLLLTGSVVLNPLLAQASRTSMSLNGIVEFEQTKTALPPEEFSRTIQVPGLIDLAKPRIEQYDAYFAGRHEPRYSWYRFRFNVDRALEHKFAVLKILKSRYNTQIFLNGHDCGTYMQCNTPVEADLTEFISFDKENVLLVRIGDRAWLPKESATGFDREKFTDIPGIWDDVSISFTGPVQIHRALILPNLKDEKAEIKLKMENRAKLVERGMEHSEIEYTLSAYLKEKKSGKRVSQTFEKRGKLKCQQFEEMNFMMDLPGAHPWSPDDPFLYEAVISISADGKYFDDYGNPENMRPADDYSWIGESDEVSVTFGMRDFNPVDRSFHLNGEEIRMFGSAITLNRFFEDRERAGLPWDREWVEEFLVTIPKAMEWNLFRACIGILPSFWYDLADEHGFLIQNEYPMWNLRGRDSQLLSEYADWVWTDGNHPSIVIWDAMNENRQPFIVDELIPALQVLDPSRIWDAGWNALDGAEVDMREIHGYSLGFGWWINDEDIKQQREAYRFGSLFSRYDRFDQFHKITSPMILNEYGWLWQHRDGKHSAVRTHGNFTENDITPFTKNYEYFEPDGTQIYADRDIYEWYLGKNASAAERWDFQAYLTGIQTETLRATRLFSGIISFAYLTNNGGHTGDWFINRIADLDPSQALLVQYHAMKSFAVFVDVEDGRYLRNPELKEPGSTMSMNLFAVNDLPVDKEGTIHFKIINSAGKVLVSETIPILVEGFWQKLIPLSIVLPDEPGGYMIMTELDAEDDDNLNQVSRRYIRVGDSKAKFSAYEYRLPDRWPEKNSSDENEPPEHCRRPADFVPFSYEFSLDQLKDNFSEDMMLRAARMGEKIRDVNEKGDWKPDLKSFEEHQCPEWFSNAKFGMFIDWGPWSVAGWAEQRDGRAMYPDWYEFRMYRDEEFREYPMIDTTGDLQIRKWDRWSETDYDKTHIAPYEEKMERLISGKVAVRDYSKDYLIPQAVEFIDMYDPDILWFDGDWYNTLEEFGTLNIVSYFYTSEYHTRHADYSTHYWEECRGISESFGYNWQYDPDNGINIEIPGRLQNESNRPCEYAYTFRIENKL
ncbi:MAG: alpha-L-fucosidase [Bacteroidota bacterium]